MTAFVRAFLWLLLILAPGGVFLLPLLVGDAVARRKRQENSSGATSPVGALATAGLRGSQGLLVAPAPGH